MVNMQNSEKQLQSIYLSMVEESKERLEAGQTFLKTYKESKSIHFLESSILQVRKALEAMAYAAIAPNKEAYEEFRSQSEQQFDFRKDFRASQIFHLLSQVNKDFYPIPLLQPMKQKNGTFQYDRKEEGYLTKKHFSKFYDRLGKYLHAHNPWSNDKQIQNLATDIPFIIKEAIELLELHASFIQTPYFKGVWIVCVPLSNEKPYVITGIASGEFVVNAS
jgi:hypothetical protein